MKNKKILIIFIIVVIAMIAITAVILLKNSNNNDKNTINESSLEKEFSNLQNELDEYLSSLNQDKYDPNLICANSENVICDTELIKGQTKFTILPSLKNSQYKDLVNVANGKLEIKSLTQEEIEYISSFIDVSEYDYDYCIYNYKEKNGSNKANVVENIATPIE